MKSKSFLSIVITAFLAIVFIIPVNAQYGNRGYERRGGHYRHTDTHGDAVVIRLNDPGTLEEKMPKDMVDRVRVLRIEGSMDNRDLAFVKKLCSRSLCVDSRNKSVDNYIDLDIEHVRLLAAGRRGQFGESRHSDVLDNALANSSNLRSIVLPERLKRIDTNALNGCTRLVEVIMPRAVLSLGNGAFSGCRRLEYITLPDGLQEIGDVCFYGCSNLANITIPHSVVKIGDKAFKGCHLERIQLPSDLETLGAKAFEDNPLTKLNIPAATRISDNDLGSMMKLETISVEMGNRYYISKDGLLYDKTGRILLSCPMARQGSLTVPDGVTEIRSRAFAGSNLWSIDLPESLSNLGVYAFTSAHLVNLNLPENLTSIPVGAFADCSGLTDVRLPERLTFIGESAFENCSSLRSIVIPQGVSVLSPRTFKYCVNLVQVTLPDQLIRIGTEAFEGCTFTSINLPKSVTMLGERAFKYCNQLTNIVVPDSCTIVGKEAFRECPSLSSVDLGNGITFLGDNALRETAITTLVLPESITHLGKKVTEKCKSLSSIECHAINPPVLDKESNNKVELRVPSNSVLAYREAKNWKNFKNILPLE